MHEEHPATTKTLLFTRQKEKTRKTAEKKKSTNPASSLTRRRLRPERRKNEKGIIKILQKPAYD